MTPNDFRTELKKVMPGYRWTVHRSFPGRLPAQFRDEFVNALAATGTQWSGSKRLSTLQVIRRNDDGPFTYTVRSSGEGTKELWLHESTGPTFAFALFVLQFHYKTIADIYQRHAAALQQGLGEEGDATPAKKGGTK